MKTLLLTALLASATLGAHAQTADPLASLDFLTGTWSATSAPASGSANAAATGKYTFSRDLAGHSLERTTSADTCKGPKTFDCEHHDRLTIFSDPNALAAHHTSLLAFYMDSEGHVIYYAVSTPDAHTVVLLSQGPASAPKFKLTYHLEGDGPKAVMSGKFQFAPPGSDDFHSYLEWSGTKQ